jgi:hypothetical protein
MQRHDHRDILRRIVELEQQIAHLQEQQAEAEATLRSLRTQLERDAAAPSSKQEISDQAQVLTAETLTSDEKISLFLRLFRGRHDMFPRLWQNQTTGKKGYAPACANEWVRGVCEKTFSPLRNLPARPRPLRHRAVSLRQRSTCLVLLQQPGCGRGGEENG